MLETMQAPAPLEHHVTRWGQNRFAKGAYSFMQPGSKLHHHEVLSLLSSREARIESQCFVSTTGHMECIC